MKPFVHSERDVVGRRVWAFGGVFYYCPAIRLTYWQFSFLAYTLTVGFDWGKEPL